MSGKGGMRRGQKERSKNFTELEKKIVLELIQKYRNVLGQGRSNIATNRRKQLVWVKICEEVNRRCGSERPRTPAQVKMWFENFKKKIKMRSSSLKDSSEPGSASQWLDLQDIKIGDDSVIGPDFLQAAKEMSDTDSNRTTKYDEPSTSNHLEAEEPLSPNPGPTLLDHAFSFSGVNPFAFEQARLGQLAFSQQLDDLSSIPLNLTNLESTRKNDQYECYENIANNHKENGSRITTLIEEKRLNLLEKRQHAKWEHEAKMRILNMELQKKEEILALQKYICYIDLKLKMETLERSNSTHT